MPRSEPSLSSGPPVLTATVLSLVSLLLVGCNRPGPAASPDNVQTETPTAPATSSAPVVPSAPPVLTRGDLVTAVGQAASAYAQGTSSASPDPLVGRGFAVRVPFGCTGPTPAPRSGRDGMAGWSWGPDRKTIELGMKPENWTDAAIVTEAGASTIWEAVEGFWIPRPWLASEACPSIKSDPLQAATLPASPQTIGLAAVFEAGGSRIGRRNGRAFELTLRPDDDEPVTPPQTGYRMLLEGRVTAFPGGRAVECRAPGPDQRPVCIVAVRLDRVAYEDENGNVLSEWRSG